MGVGSLSALKRFDRSFRVTGEWSGAFFEEFQGLLWLILKLFGVSDFSRIF